MNIQKAKEQVKNAIIAYRTKDEFGRSVLPTHRQRPIFLLGAPGIGKTAIMEQIAQELGLPLVSYSMTHHTRQSALGLPWIRDEEFDGQSFRVSEYTMSEIIASVYRAMRESGVREGILFLDEINCVSETLAPSMLQFLQYKVFGQHKVPEGWIVVTAGNPPEYNSSVREFDMATWDRLKRVDVEPDYEIWRGYAIAQNAHPAIISYLDVRRGDFYQAESDVDGKRFVTPRGWIDLSDMLWLYERHGIPVDDTLTAQYLQSPDTARQFAIYYDLWLKYRSDYQVPQILSGTASPDILQRAQRAPFDERIALVGLLMDGVRAAAAPVMAERALLEAGKKRLKEAQDYALTRRTSLQAALTHFAEEARGEMQRKQAGNMLSRQEERHLRALMGLLSACAEAAADGDAPAVAAAFERVKPGFNQRVKALKDTAAAARAQLDNLFAFAEPAFGDGQEMLILVTELTAAQDVSRFIATYGCDAYFRHNKELLFYERQISVLQQLQALDGLEE